MNENASRLVHTVKDCGPGVSGRPDRQGPQLLSRRQLLAGIAVGGGGATVSSAIARTVPSFESLAEARGSRIADDVQMIELRGFAEANDGGAALYARALSAPSHFGCFQTADGALWEISADVLHPQMFGAVSDGVRDCRPPLERTFSTATALGRRIFVPAGTYRLSAAPDDPWCIRIPSGTRLDLTAEPLFQATSGLQPWKRIVSLIGASDVRISGTLRIDGNVRGLGAEHNEHMHGLFIFDCDGVDIDHVVSENCRGDNVFIGGADDTLGSRNVRIDSINAMTAGRKNLVLTACSDVTIGSARLDNRDGGAKLFGGTPDSTDGNCLDVEPDVFSGRVANGATFGRLVCFGAGVDFTAGVNEAAAAAWVLRVDEFEIFITPRAGVPAWTQNAITIIVRRLAISGLDGTDAQSRLFYAARLHVDDMTLNGARAREPVLLIAQAGGFAPSASFGNLSISNSAQGGMGIENRDATVRIKTFIPSTSSVALWTRGVSSSPNQTATTDIETARLDAIGEPDQLDFALLSTKAGRNIPRLTISQLVHSDRRIRPVTRVLQLEGGAENGATIGSYRSLTGTPITIPSTNAR